MAMSRVFKSYGSSIIGNAIVLSVASLLLLVACGEDSMRVTSDCSGQDKKNADRYYITLKQGDG